MITRFMSGLVLVAALAACGADEAPSPDAAQPAAALTPPVMTASDDSLSADSARALPPGLAPVAVDPDPREQVRPPRTGPQQPAAPPSTGTPPTATPPALAEPVAQDDGAEILRRAAAAYEGVRSMQADFVMQFNNPLLRQQTTSRGTLYQQRPDRIALRFSDPAGDVILSDGEHFYIYQPSIDPRQATQAPASAGGGGVDLQAQFVGNPTERFRWVVEGTENVGDRPARVLTLVPRSRAEYRSLKVWFDTRDSLARRFEITEHNGSVRRFDLSGLRVNPAIPAEVFRFSAPAGVRIVRVG